MFYTWCGETWSLSVSSTAFYAGPPWLTVTSSGWGTILLDIISPLCIVHFLHGTLLAYTCRSPPLPHKCLLTFQSTSALLPWEIIYIFINICQIPLNISLGTLLFFFLMFGGFFVVVFVLVCFLYLEVFFTHKNIHSFHVESSVSFVKSVTPTAIKIGNIYISTKSNSCPFAVNPLSSFFSLWCDSVPMVSFCFRESYKWNSV